MISIEHVLPQNPPEKSKWTEWFPTQDLRDHWVHRLGNLLLLNHKKNSSASNYDFDKKKAAYFTKGGVSPFPLTTQSVSESEWTLAVVESRQKKLVKTLREVWRISVGDSLDETELEVENGETETGSEKVARDYTKYDVTIDGITHEALPKRTAIFTVVKQLCLQGISPEEIAALVPWRSTMFCSMNGTVGSEEFVTQLKSKVDSGDIRRYFCEADQLIYSNGRTYAVSNGWGSHTFKAIQNILAKFPQCGVTCEEHAK
jgi:hypothetical protein